MPKDFRFIDLFAGIGGLRAGFDRIGGRCVFTSEWNTFSQKTYAENFEDDPEHVFNGDITKVDEKDIPAHDVLLAGFPCFAAGTLIETDRGHVPIEKVEVGDLVMTHGRRYRPVLTLMSKPDAQLHRVKPKGLPPIWTTAEHPFYARKAEHDATGKRVGPLGKPEWVDAADLTQDHYLARPTEISEQRDVQMDWVWYVVGLVAGGFPISKMMWNPVWPDDLPHGYKTRIWDKLARAGVVSRRPEGDMIITECSEKIVVPRKIVSASPIIDPKDFAQKLDMIIGERNLAYMLRLPYALQKSLWAGWLDSPAVALNPRDGSVPPDLLGQASGDPGKFARPAASLHMALLMSRVGMNVTGRMIAVRSGTFAGVFGYKTGYLRKEAKHAVAQDGFVWVRVKSSAPQRAPACVYNIEVAEDNSYVAGGVVVHNCQPFSIAGVSKKNSMGRAHGFADQTQGTLFFDVVRILRHHKPKAFLLENVKNLVSHDKGNTFKVITETLDELGYDVSYRVISAKHWVPQNRERIFIVGFRKDLGLPFNFDDVILPGGPAPVLRDILHPEDGSEIPEPPFTDADGFVNAKYTLTPKLWDYLQNYAAKHKAAGNGFGYGLCGPESVARTLSARYGKDGSEILIDQPGGRPRRLTPRECARLMGFDRKGSNRPWQIPVSDSQAYKQFGNAVAPPVSIAIADAMNARIQEALALDGGAAD